MKEFFPSFWCYIDLWPCCEATKSKTFRWGLFQSLPPMLCFFFCFIGLLLNVKHLLWKCLDLESTNSVLQHASIGRLRPTSCLAYSSDVWVWVTHHNVTFGSKSSELCQIYTRAVTKSGVESLSNLLRRYYRLFAFVYESNLLFWPKRWLFKACVCVCSISWWNYWCCCNILILIKVEVEAWKILNVLIKLFVCNFFSYMPAVPWSPSEHHLQPGLCERGDRHSPAFSVPAACYCGTGRRCQVEGASGHHWVHATAGRPAGEFIPPFTLQSKCAHELESFQTLVHWFISASFYCYLGFPTTVLVSWLEKLIWFISLNFYSS